MTWVVGVATWEESARSEGASTPVCGIHDTPVTRAVVVVVVVVALEERAIKWHVLTPNENGTEAGSILEQLRVLLDDLLWNSDTSRAEDIHLVAARSLPCTLAQHLREIAAHRWLQIMATELLIDQERMEESIELLLHPQAATEWKQARARLSFMGFNRCVETLYRVVHHEAAKVLENPRLEHTFQFTVQIHTEPLRSFMRMNATARATVQQPIISLFRPCLRTKQGRECLLARLDRPELDETVLCQWHNLLDELIQPVSAEDTKSDGSCVSTLLQLLDWMADGETNLPWAVQPDRTTTQSALSMQDFRVFCEWSERINAYISAFHHATSTATTLHLHATHASLLAGVATNVLTPFVTTTQALINAFEGTEHQPYSSADSLDVVQSLRRQVAACESLIHNHRDEMATTLLLHSYDRIKIVFEDETNDLGTSSSGSRSKARATTTASVLFRVTRQDAHRVFQASSRSKRTTGGDKSVTLAYSRRTTGVWFSTPRLDTLAVQWRALHVEISRLESQLVTSLKQAFDRDVRAPLRRLVSSVGQLDVLAAFAHVSIRCGYSRAATTSGHKSTQVIELTGVRWPWDAPLPAQSPRLDKEQSLKNETRIRLDASHPLLVVHSAIDGDGSLPTRIALAQVLHQIGCFVPCTPHLWQGHGHHARLSLADALLVRAGTTDCTVANQSTFLSEMQQMATTLDRATSRSLVVIDELCRGTAPAEGLPLALEICRFLADKHVITCVATQWTELLDALLHLNHATVPVYTQYLHEQRQLPEDESKQLYTEQLHDCDRRFISSLYDVDFPVELLSLIESDLQEK